MEQAITATGADQIKGVYAANDGTAGGAIAAMKANGVDPKQVPVTGQDAELTGDPADPRRRAVHDGLQAVSNPRRGRRRAGGGRSRTARSPPADLVTDEFDNGAMQVPTAVYETIAVTLDNVNDTIIADDVYPVDEICAGQYAQACKDAGISSPRRNSLTREER